MHDYVKMREWRWFYVVEKGWVLGCWGDARLSLSLYLLLGSMRCLMYTIVLNLAFGEC